MNSHTERPIDGFLIGLFPSCSFSDISPRVRKSKVFPFQPVLKSSQVSHTFAGYVDESVKLQRHYFRRKK